MAIDFPNSPTNGDTHVVGSFTWQYDGEKWISANGITLDGLSNVTVPSPTSGDFLKWNGTAWVNDAVDLGTDTTGNYMSDLTQGTGVTITHTPGEGSNATVAIGQSVATSASVTFAQVDTTGDLTVGGNFTVNGTTTTLNTETLSIEDNTIVLNSNVSASPSVNAGIEIERGTSSNVQIRWNETTDKWQFTNDGTNYTDFGAGGALISKLPNYRTTTTRTNLVPNPNFEVDTTGWSGFNSATIARSTAQFYVGAASLQITNSASGNSGFSTTTQTDTPVVAGQTYTWSGYMKSQTGTIDNMSMFIIWYNSGITEISRSFSATATATTSWQRMSVTGTAPVGAVYAFLRFARQSATTAGTVWFADGMLFEVSASALPYFDGTYADAYTGYTLTEQAWNGTADASTSTATWGQDSSYVAPIEGALWFDSDTAQTFVYYDSSWIEIGATAMGATVSTTAPNSPIGGQIWFNSDTGGTYVYYGSAWVEVGAAPVNLLLQAIDAKGDLLVGTADNTVDNLAVGANGSVLMADSSTATGLSWSTQPLSNRNVLINGAMNVWQRGTSPTAGAYAYISDRFQGGPSAVQTNTRQSSSLDSLPYCARIQRNSTSTSTTPIVLAQNIETLNSTPLQGKIVTLSFYARKGANFSATSDLITCSILSGTGTDQNAFGGFTGSAIVANTTKTVTASWQRFTLSGTVGSTANELFIQIYFTPTGTAGAADYLEITGVQLEAGAVATPFEFEDFGTTLAKCQRYYEKTYDIGTDPGTATYNGMFTIGTVSNPTNNNIIPVRFKVEKRVSPTMTAYRPADGVAGYWGYGRSGANGSSVVTFDLLSTAGCRAYHNIGAAWAANVVEAHWVASAEL